MNSPLPQPFPFPLDAHKLGHYPTKEALAAINVIITLLQRNCARLRSAVLLFERVNEKTPHSENYDFQTIEGTMAYADAVTEFNHVSNDWLRLSARDAVYAAQNFKFLIDLVCSKPNKFFGKEADEAIKTFTTAASEISQRYPNLSDLRNGAAHSDQIVREYEKNAINSTIDQLFVSIQNEATILITDGLNGTKYVTTNRGVLHELDITRILYWVFYIQYCNIGNALSHLPPQMQAHLISFHDKR